MLFEPFACHTRLLWYKFVFVAGLTKHLHSESVGAASCCNDLPQFRAVGLFVCVFVGGATVVDEASPHLLRVASWFASGERVAQRCQAFSGIRSVRRAFVRHFGDFYSCPAQKLREG